MPEPTAPGTDDFDAAPIASLKIAVDAMGGDFAPAEAVRGALAYVAASQAGGETDAAQMVLVGDAVRIHAEIAASGADPLVAGAVRVHHTSQIIEMGEHAIDALRDKRDSSIVVCAEMVKRGEVQAAFSAGNTGAVMVTAMQTLDRIEGIKRPAIATFMPTDTGGRAVILDAGANVDCRPSHLLHFALLGAVYARQALGVANPRVGLLANGEEEGKGDELTRAAHGLLKAARPRINFIGNIEGNHVFEGAVDVVVCDGFVGNVLLKTAEGTARMTLSLLAAQAEAASDPAARDTLLQALLLLKRRVDYTEFGGAPLLGVNGITFIAHGRSDARAFETGIRLAAQAARSGFVEAVRIALKQEAAGGAA